MAAQRSRSSGLGVIFLQILTFILWATLKVKCDAEQVSVTCPDGWKIVPPERPDGKGVCLLGSPSRLTMLRAKDYCVGEDAVLAIPPSDYYRQQMLQNATMRGWDDVWINARGGNRMWNWDYDRRRLQLQGCWTDDPADHDLEMEVKPPSKSVESCTEKCRSMNYAIASVQMTSTPGLLFQNDFACRCGKIFGKHQRVKLAQCQTRCPQAPKGSLFEMLCGGQGVQTVFIVNGPSASMNTLLSHAALELPYWNPQSTGECATIMVGSNIRWDQTNCHRRKPYICQYKMETCTSKEGTMWFSNTCVTLHRDEETWFKARELCLNKGGKLLTVDVPHNRFMGTDMATELGGFTWWIGLSIYTWTKTDGTSLPPYNGWRAAEPIYNDTLPNICVHALKTDEFRWSTSPCHGMKNFYCTKDPVITPLTVPPTTHPPVTSMGPGSTLTTVRPPRPRPPVTFIDMSTTVVAESTPSPTGNTQPQGGLSAIFIGAIGAGVGVGFVLIVIGIWCCCRRCTSSSKDSSKDFDENGKPRRLPSIPGGGRGVHRIKGKTVRYLSDPALSLNHLPPEDIEDDGEYDYIDIELKKDGAGEENGLKYQGLTDSMKKKKAIEILETEYEDLRPNGGLPEDNYIIPMEPPKTVNGVVPPVVPPGPNEKPPMGMSMPKRVPKTVEDSLRIRDSSRDSKPEPVAEVKPIADTKAKEAVSTVHDKESIAEKRENANAKPEETEETQAEYADLSAVEDSDDEDISPKGVEDDEDISPKGMEDDKDISPKDVEDEEDISPQTPNDKEVIPDEGKADTKLDVDNDSDGEAPSESVIEIEKAT